MADARDLSMSTTPKELALGLDEASAHAALVVAALRHARVAKGVSARVDEHVHLMDKANGAPGRGGALYAKQGRVSAYPVIVLLQLGRDGTLPRSSIG